jgi:predicted dehydrogenase
MKMLVRGTNRPFEAEREEASLEQVMIIGAGAIARAHARAAMRSGEPVTIGVTDPSAEAIKQFIAEFPEARVFDSLHDMLNSPCGKNDVVINATPPFCHMEPTIAALRSGRHVLCEKPLAMTEDQALQMLAAADSSGRLLGCCSTRLLGLPAAEQVRKLMRDGAMGDLYQMTFVNRYQRTRSGIEHQPSSRWFLEKQKSGGGVLMDWGPYDMACLMDVFRPQRITVVSAWIARPETGVDPTDVPLQTEQHFSARLILHLPTDQKLPVNYERAACTHGGDRSIVEIEGTRGAVKWDWSGSGGSVTRSFDREGKVESESGDYPDQSGLHPHDKPFIFFRKAIRGENSPAIIGSQAVFNFTCIRAIYAVAETMQPQTVILRN